MKRPFLFSLLLASAALGQVSSGGGSDLITVLRGDSDTRDFAQLLEDHPDLLTHLSGEKNYTVFAPSNSAVASFRLAFSLNGTLAPRSHGLHRRAIPDYDAAIALLFTDQSNQENLDTQPANLITNLTDPAFINIAPAPASASLTQSSSATRGSSASSSSASTSVLSTSTSELPTSSSASFSATSVRSTSGSKSDTVQPTSSHQPPTSSPTSQTSSSSASSASSYGASLPCFPSQSSTPHKRRSYSPISRRQRADTSLKIYSGFGRISNVSSGETSYGNGAVRKIDSFFTLFGDLQSTLQQTNGSVFSNALSNAGMLASLSSTPRITIFVPVDSALQGKTLDANSLKRYVLLNTLGTTVSLTAGSYTSSAGDSITVQTSSDGTVYVNGSKIVKPNVMIKNGVINYIDKEFTASSTFSSSSTTKFSSIPALAVVVAIAASCASVVVCF